ncbi:hypothetical protein MML48_9g00005867 [Holotrichia oblita]|uniref:Uncharacterized protein n=1 Tax=Holotrichia oblita TaxID=644536 RepID=A0ACB9SP96_HOLOL|nr:hypothetical protein MML48_9g00005867 [Holotrichia oblita]
MTYQQNSSSTNQEECMNALTESEKFLTRYYKRLVTGGKGSRPVVILFPGNIQQYINKIIEIRKSTNLVPSDNPYLFGYPDTNHWARGDVAIRKFARNADIAHPDQITSNKLRKHIATVMQILNLNKEESEQFAQFMGQTEKMSVGHEACGFHDISDRFNVSISTVHCIIKRVTYFISGLSEEFINWPNLEKQEEIARYYITKRGFPQVIGIEYICHFTRACCVLHNMGKMEETELFTEPRLDGDLEVDLEPHQNVVDSAIGKALRNEICNQINSH